MTNRAFGSATTAGRPVSLGMTTGLTTRRDVIASRSIPCARWATAFASLGPAGRCRTQRWRCEGFPGGGERSAQKCAQGEARRWSSPVPPHMSTSTLGRAPLGTFDGVRRWSAEVSLMTSAGPPPHRPRNFHVDSRRQRTPPAANRGRPEDRCDSRRQHTCPGRYLLRSAGQTSPPPPPTSSPAACPALSRRFLLWLGARRIRGPMQTFPNQREDQCHGGTAVTSTEGHWAHGVFSRVSGAGCQSVACTRRRNNARVTLVTAPSKTPARGGGI